MKYIVFFLVKVKIYAKILNFAKIAFAIKN